MQANPDKFQVISGGKKPYAEIKKTYNITGEENVKLLGVEFDYKLIFLQPNNKNVQKAANS